MAAACILIRDPPTNNLREDIPHVILDFLFGGSWLLEGTHP